MQQNFVEAEYKLQLFEGCQVIDQLIAELDEFR